MEILIMRRGIQDFSLTVHDGLFDRVEWVPDAAAIAAAGNGSLPVQVRHCLSPVFPLIFLL